MSEAGPSSSSPPVLPDPNKEAPLLDTERGFTAQDLIEQQERLEAQANEAIPFRFDECTFARGYIRQPVFACKTCGHGGICAGCSVTCHGDHELVELFHRRHFRCDCGTPNLYRLCPDTPHKRDTGYPADARPCQLRSKDVNKGWDVPNDENVYTHNFEGAFCRCERGKTYDPDTEDEVMYQCLVCEDWFHESCLSLRPSTQSKPLLTTSQFDVLLCDACMRQPSAWLLRRYAGQPGWLVPVPPKDDDPSWRTLGSTSSEDNATEPMTKRRRTECSKPASSVLGSVPGRWDVYLTHQFRDALCRCEACAKAWESYPYVWDEEETYDPPMDRDDSASATSTSSTYERGMAMLSQLPRPQMLESLRAYQELRDALFEHLRPYAESHEPVSEEAVRAFFRDHVATRSSRDLP